MPEAELEKKRQKREHTVVGENRKFIGITMLLAFSEIRKSSYFSLGFGILIEFLDNFWI